MRPTLSAGLKQKNLVWANNNEGRISVPEPLQQHENTEGQPVLGAADNIPSGR